MLNCFYSQCLTVSCNNIDKGVYLRYWQDVLCAVFNIQICWPSPLETTRGTFILILNHSPPRNNSAFHAILMENTELLLQVEGIMAWHFSEPPRGADNSRWLVNVLHPNYDFLFMPSEKKSFQTFAINHVLVFIKRNKIGCTQRFFSLSCVSRNVIHFVACRHRPGFDMRLVWGAGIDCGEIWGSLRSDYHHPLALPDRLLRHFCQ